MSEEAIRMILLTRKGERPMRPRIRLRHPHPGSSTQNDAGTARDSARRYVQEALMRWEPRYKCSK